MSKINVQHNDGYIEFSFGTCEPFYDMRLSTFEKQQDMALSILSEKQWYTSHVAMQTERVLLANGVKIAKA